MPSDNHIVHRALTGRRNHLRQCLRQRPEQHIGNPLRCFYIPSGHPPLRARINQRSLRRMDPQRPQATLVRRRLFPQQTAHYIETRRHRNRFRRIDTTGPLRRSAGKVDFHFIARHRDGHRDRHRLLGKPVIVHIIHDAIHAIGNILNRPAGHPFRVVQQCRHVFRGFGYPVTLKQFPHPLLAYADGRRLRRQIPLALIGRAGIAAD